HAQYDAHAYPSYRTIRMGQIVQLASGLSPISSPVVTAGDFNMRDTAPEYRAFTGLTGMRDCAAVREHRQATSLGSNPYHAGGAVDDSRIDYVFVRDGLESAIDVIDATRIFDADLEIDGHRAAYSDHAGLLVDVSIPGKVGSAHTPNPLAVELARAGLSKGRELAEGRQRRERWEALASLGIGGLAVASRRSAPLERRKFLRSLLLGVAAVGTGSALGLAALSEFAVRQELENYQAVGHLLDELLADSSVRGRSAHAGARPALGQKRNRRIPRIRFG
ncbi:MAG: endonuclease/exonuclease/phosphatase family protein, partial [Myxococcota bacterium]